MQKDIVSKQFEWIRITDQTRSHFSKERFEISTIQQFEDDDLRMSLETDSDQPHDVRVIELAEILQSWVRIYYYDL